MKAFILAGLLMIAGCNGGGLTPNQKLEATKQWNDARASVLASLANDQYNSGNFDKCQETLDQALRLEPDNVSLHLLAARLAVEQGKLEVARAHLAVAGRLDPKNADVDYLTGVVMQRWRQPRQACDAYAMAVAKNPTELSYLLAESEMLVELRKPADALALLQSKSAFFEHSGVLRDEMGQILVQLKQLDQAIPILREASILASDDSTIREHLAFALHGGQHFAEAAEVFARLAKDPAYEKRADVLAALGDCQFQINQLHEAIASYRSATQLQPNCAGYWMALARAQVQLDDLPAAEIDIRRVMSIEPGCADAKCLLGYVRLKENNLPASLAAFREASDLDPTDSVSMCLQGYVLQRMGRNSDARPCYGRALQINPKDDLANRLMATLDSHD